jgi:DNA polymerase-1
VGSAHRELVIALGNSAVRSLLNNHSLKITTERGKAYQTEWGVVVAAFHPAAVLRAFGEYPRFLTDLRYAAGFLQGQQIKDPGVTRWDLVTPTNIKRVVDFLTTQPYLGADIETHMFNPREGPILCLSVAWTPNRTAVFPIAHPKDAERNLWPWNTRSGYFYTLKRLLEDPRPEWIWHNGKFDSSFFVEKGIEARVDHDTMLMHYALNEQRGTHDLAQLGADFLGAPNWKDAMAEDAIKVGDIESKKETFAKIRPSILYPYNARDADLTYQLYFPLRKQLEKAPSLVRLYEHLFIPASKFLQTVESYGTWVSTEYLDEADEIYQARLESDRHDILKVVEPLWDPVEYTRRTHAAKEPKFFNPGSWQHKLYVLRDVLGYRIADTRKETLEALPKNDLVDALLRWMKTAKVISTYIRGVQERIDNDGRIHATYLIHGTTTGRLSSRNPNMQNIPRDAAVKNIFQAPPGKLLVEFDYSQAELRVLAVFSDDEFLKEVYRTGRDLHDEVSAALFPGWKKDTLEGQELRIRAKFLNFGIAYGRGAKSIHEEFGMPMADAQKMVRDWFRRAPKAASYIDSCRRAPQEGRLLKTPFGRRRRFSLVTRDNLVPIQNEAVNFAIQSTASDLTLLSAIRMHETLVNRWEAHIVNLVHDSILIEVPASADLKSMTSYVKGFMESLPGQILHTDLPFVADAKIGTRWGDLQK